MIVLKDCSLELAPILFTADRNHPFLNSAQQGMQQTPDCYLNPLA
jgi:hypothetical protein